MAAWTTGKNVLSLSGLSCMCLLSLYFVLLIYCCGSLSLVIVNEVFGILTIGWLKKVIVEISGTLILIKIIVSCVPSVSKVSESERAPECCGNAPENVVKSQKPR